MSCRMKGCCFFDNTKDASFASGIFTVIISLITIVYEAATFGKSSAENEGEGEILSIVGLTIQVLFIIFSFILFYGVKKGNRILLIPWMIWMIIDIILEFIIAIFACIAIFAFMQIEILIFLVIVLALTGLNITCFIVVKSHYQSLAASTADVEAPPSYQVLMKSHS